MSQIRIIEVGLRDGLQNEKTMLSVGTRLELARLLAEAGSHDLEIGAFVSPQWVPQMAGSRELILQVLEERELKSSPFRRTRLSALVPNRRGLDDALSTRIQRIAIFTSATESFSKKNINCSIKDSLIRYADVVAEALRHKQTVRGYLSMCFGCPFEGKVSPAKVIRLAEKLIEMGCDEVSFGDTIGVADPKQVKSLVRALISAVGRKHIALHFHDTRGTALANILAALDLGITAYDASLGGLGGCPYAPAASGNVATEDVVYMLHRMGIKTGLKLDKLIEANRFAAGKMGRELSSKVSRAGLPRLLPVAE